MVHVRFLGSAPCFMAGFKSVFGADDFSFEERRQGRVVLREACMQTCQTNSRTELTKYKP